MRFSVVAFCYIKDKIWREKQIRIAREKCNEYVKYACDHQNEIISNKTSAIILGQDVPITIFPHMALVQIWPEKNKRKVSSCGGSLISEYFVLSAAHCIYHVKNYQIAIKLGSATRFADDTGQWFRASEIYVHPEYSDYSGVNDVLLIKLDRKVNFSRNARPICLNTKFNIELYDLVIATGWGRTEYQNYSPRLKMVEITLFHPETCCKITKHFHNPNIICAVDPNSSKSVHQGDSGGPLQVRLDTCAYVYEQIGVIHAVQNCEIRLDKPLYSLYTKVEPYVPWIASNVWPDEP
ncbi:granzyme G-like [Planococcus citri]|uniref:granzyme G-like n=1 Tax=Planococcus citri TaxID=170843 RepID=UPI0031F75987